MFWLDVLSSNSLCLMSTISMMYFLFLHPPIHSFGPPRRPIIMESLDKPLNKSWSWVW